MKLCLRKFLVSLRSQTRWDTKFVFNIHIAAMYLGYVSSKEQPLSSPPRPAKDLKNLRRVGRLETAPSPWKVNAESCRWKQWVSDKSVVWKYSLPDRRCTIYSVIIVGQMWHVILNRRRPPCTNSCPLPLPAPPPFCNTWWRSRSSLRTRSSCCCSTWSRHGRLSCKDCGGRYVRLNAVWDSSIGACCAIQLHGSARPRRNRSPRSPANCRRRGCRQTQSDWCGTRRCRCRKHLHNMPCCQNGNGTPKHLKLTLT